MFQYHPQNGRQLCAEEANFKDLEDGLDDIAHAISSGFSALFTETEEEKRQREYARAEHERSMEIRRAQREEQQRQAAAAYHAQQQAAAARAQTLHTAMRMARTEAPTILVEGLKIGDFCAEAMGVYDLVWTADHQLDVDAVNNKPQWKARNGNSNAGLNMYWAPEPVAGAGQPSGYWWIGGTTNPGGGLPEISAHRVRSGPSDLSAHGYRTVASCLYVRPVGAYAVRSDQGDHCSTPKP